MRKLRIYPDEVLQQKCRPVESRGEFVELVEDMKKVMIDQDGVGLAEPRVGELVQLFMLDVGAKPENEAGGRERKIRTYFNPEVIEVTDYRETSEACLSFPGATVEIERASKVHFRALNISGQQVEREVENLQARSVQHQVEHLREVTLADHASLHEKFEIHEKLKEYR